MPATSVRPLRGTGAAVIAVLLGLFAVVLAAFAGPASADPYAPSTGCTVSTSTASAGPGDSVTFVGSGFKPDQSVSLSVPSASASLGKVTTTSSGSFTGTFTWPTSVTGNVSVRASAPSASCSFTLIDKHSNTAATNGHRSSAAGSGLSSTGFAALTATTIALLLIGAGAIFLGLARRKRV